MSASTLMPAPKSNPPIGSPPIIPDSAVRVAYSNTRSSLATRETPSGMPIPRLTMLLGFNSKAARLAMILRQPISRGGIACMGTLCSQLNAAL
ncbi:MAG: hypothetical protein ACD_75C01611G0001 [uncultured bacterium]|nr:MAG: hypothetical protein ACD_75C01611G0001 [uncultured bacterium]